MFETNDEYFDYYRDYHAFWKICGIGPADTFASSISERDEIDPGPASRPIPILNGYPVASYLVTGGAGFIGSHLAEELLRRGHRVRVVDSLITGKRRNLESIPAAEFVEGDLAELAVAEKAAAGMDFVLHQAAIPSVPRSVEDPATSNRANITATLNVLLAARKAGVKRLVYAGSSSASGDTPTLPETRRDAHEPAVAMRPSKTRGEQCCQMFAKAVRLPDGDHARWLRFRTAARSGVAVFGRHLAVCGGRARWPIPIIHGDGGQTRDFTHRQRGGRRAREPARRQMSPAGHQRRHGWPDLVERPAARAERPRQDERAGDSQGAARGDVRDSQADLKARALLGFKPIVSFEERPGTHARVVPGVEA